MLSMICCTLLGAVSVKVRPPSRRASFEIALSHQAIGHQAIDHQAIGPSAAAPGDQGESLDDAVFRFRSSDLIRETVVDLSGLDPSTELVESIRQHLRLAPKNKESPNILVGSFVGDDDAFVLTFLRVHTRNWLDQHMRVLSAEARDLARQFRIAALRLERYESELLEFRESTDSESTDSPEHDPEQLESLRAREKELQLSYTASMEDYRRLYKKLRTAEAQLDLERARYDVISQPHLHQVPERRVLAQRSGVGGLIGLALGGLVALGLSARRR